MWEFKGSGLMAFDGIKVIKGQQLQSAPSARGRFDAYQTSTTQKRP